MTRLRLQGPNYWGMRDGDLLGDTDPLVVAEDPHVGEAFIAVRDRAIALAEADVVESCGHDGVIADRVGDEKVSC